MARAHKIETTLHMPKPLSKKMEQALASLELEGITLPSDSLEDIVLLDNGTMSKEEFLAKTRKIAKS